MNTTTEWICYDSIEHLVKNTTLMRYVSKDDLRHLRKRIQHEGLEFLTVTLPRLGKAMESGLSTGSFVLPTGFKGAQGTCLPIFMASAFGLLFEKNGKRINHDHPFIGTECEPDSIVSAAAACQAIRQITLMCYKMKLPYSSSTTAAVKQRFKDVEQRLGQLNERQWVDDVHFRIARNLVHRLLAGLDPFDVRPRHGNGASACRRAPHTRYTPLRYIPYLDKWYPYTEYMYSGLNSLSDSLLSLHEMPVERKPKARVCYVPKDSRGPRLISCEPCELLYIQLGQMAKLYAQIRDKYPNVRAMLDCTDQTRNQQWAREASVYEGLATLDMKDASDSVSLKLVKYLFPKDWYIALRATRSTATVFPCGETIYLNKFASMGSGNCFPVEAIVFWALALSVVAGSDAQQWAFGRQRTIPVSIFGDDIVVPSSRVDKLDEVFTLAGLTRNRDKSYIDGPYRESCGTEWYRGYDVSIVRMNHPPVSAENSSTKGQLCSSAMRYCDFASNAISHYGTVLTDGFRCIMIGAFGFKVPVLPYRPSGSLCLEGNNVHDCEIRQSRDTPGRPHYCTREARLLVERGRKRRVDTSDWSHVLRALLETTGDAGADVIGLTNRSAYSYKWVSF